ncbi:hypothetical protein GCM10008018_13270 [Paenibacillus marchantiophytorum]|uniref:HTH araC/xylS-type domain-containing protein n=1 Tax=Paenibacillus marchantiophytorum TaxID=1619310 RepID=A0ABQ2BTD8_9BACL|nr:hypothetical protein GCM10008018_13270 [Paenibacillus marchantiophytorum]
MPSTDHPEINKILEYVNNNYDKELTLRGMAKYVNMCEQVGFVHLNYFLKQFKKRTGATPSEFRVSKKTERINS